MDSGLIAKLHVLLLLSSLLFLQAAGEVGRSVLFLDGLNHRFFRDHSSELGLESRAISLTETTAAISALLGFAPPTSLTVESSSKLDKLLLPNPFDRPRAVFMVEVRGTEVWLPTDAHSKSGGSSSFSYKILGSNNADIELPVVADEDELSVIHLDEPSDCAACLNKEFSDLAHLLGGTYVGSIEALDGELTFPLASGTSFTLNVSKKSDVGFASALASLLHGIKKDIEIHEDFAGSIHSPAELLTGVFTGIEALNEYGPEVAQKGQELFQTALVKIFGLLQKHYEGKIVGVVIFDKEPSPDSLSMIDLTFPIRAARVLEGHTVNAIIPAVLLVRLSLAWITGIILLVATLIGVYFLLNMPLTRDTLLYANVKLD